VQTVETIAHKIAGPDADEERLELAWRIGDAQVDLNRVRAHKTGLTICFLADSEYQPLRVLKQQLRSMKTIDHIQRTRGTAFKIWEIEEMTGLEPLEGDDKVVAI
jgi:hypothetical protein